MYDDARPYRSIRSAISRDFNAPELSRALFIIRATIFHYRLVKRRDLASRCVDLLPSSPFEKSKGRLMKKRKWRARIGKSAESLKMGFDGAYV